MSTITLDAETRTQMGKGASRRLRRLENKIPAIIYGGEKKPHLLHLLHNKITKALEDEAIYSTVLNLKVDGKVEHVLLKDIQRHPFKPVILHMDFLRVSLKDIVVKMIPLHFINESNSLGVKAGGFVSHLMTQVEVRCEVRHLPAFIEVDLAKVELDQTLHLSDIELPKQVELATELDEAHDHPVISIHLSKVDSSLEEEKIAEDEEEAKALEAKAEGKEASSKTTEESDKSSDETSQEND